MKFRTAIWPLMVFLACCLQVNAQSISGVVNSYYQVTAINTIANTLTLNSTSGLSAGTKVLMIQMKGATINSGNAATYGDITAINNAGNYEFNYICSITGNDVFLKFSILKPYTISGQVQLVSVPVYSSVTIAGTVTAAPWNPVSGTGGIVAIEATNTIFLNSNINVSGQGFLGGALQNYPAPPYDCTWAVDVSEYSLSLPPSDAYHTGGRKGEGIANYITNQEYGRGKLSNGGGGGNNTNTGGAGGGNYGVGGNGGQRSNESFFQCHGTHPGIGGLSLSGFGYSLAVNRIFHGGGGGSGHENNGVSLPGGNGGGIIILTAPLISGTGQSLLANGISPLNPTNADPTTAEGDGGGGGGAGGTVIINATVVTGSISAQANGARGSDASNMVNDCTGPGGGGGAGVIWSAGGSFPAAITGSVAGGNNGVVNVGSSLAACRGLANGATAGANGNIQTGFIPPMGTAEVCALLATPDLQYFRGSIQEDAAQLLWAIQPSEDISTFILESSFDRMSYQTIATIDRNEASEWKYLDNRKWWGTAYYRLKMITRDGSSHYSIVLPLSRNHEEAFQLISLQPNPAREHLAIALYSKKSMKANIILYNAFGQKIRVSKQEISVGYSAFQLNISELAPGAYMVMIEGNGSQAVKPFLKIR